MIVAGVVFLMMHAQQSSTVYLIDLKTWMQAKKAPLSPKKNTYFSSLRTCITNYIYYVLFRADLC